jgi:hypothetical protein
MQAEPSNIVKSILGRDNLADVPKDEIQRLVQEHPYSPVIRYLLTKRLQLSSDPGYADSVGMTAIYFNNPHWLSLLLRRQTASERTAELEESLGLAHAESQPVETADAQLAEERIDEVAAVRGEVTSDEVSEEDLTEDGNRILAEGYAEGHGEPPPYTTEATEGDNMVSRPYADEEQSEGAGYLQSAELEAVSAHATAADTPAANDTGSTGTQESDNDDDASRPREDETPVELPSPVMESEASPETAEAVEAHVADSAPGLQREEESMSPPHTAGQEPQGEALPDAPEALGETEVAVPIQPLHTQDYFASLGVRLEDEPPAPSESRLQSFPAWLRTMKPLHPAGKPDTPAQGSLVQEVRQGAEESNEEELILTEAMAEVFAKQGLRLKAIDIYRKLSLLHPDKSSIFALKIEQLKGITP